MAYSEKKEEKVLEIITLKWVKGSGGRKQYDRIEDLFDEGWEVYQPMTIENGFTQIKLSRQKEE